MGFDALPVFEGSAAGEQHRVDDFDRHRKRPPFYGAFLTEAGAGLNVSSD
jgi:hypothetical protein